MFHPSLTKEKKLEIARLYHMTDMSMEEIKDTVGVSLRSVYNHKDHGYEDTVSPVSSMPMEEKPSQSKKNQWECKRCGFITDRRLSYCHNCGCGPFHSFFTKAGSPEHIPYVPPKKEPETIESEGETVDYTIDHWICKECDYISNTEFVICPECSCDQVIFAPNGIEPRDDHEQSTSENRQDGSDQTEDVDDQQTLNQDMEQEQTEFDEESPVVMSEAPEISPGSNVEPEDKDNPWILPAVLVCGGAVTLLATRPDVIQKLFQAFQNGNQIGTGFESTRPQFSTKKQMFS